MALPVSDVKVAEKAAEKASEIVVKPGDLPPPGKESPLACFYDGSYIYCGQAASGEWLWKKLPLNRYQAHLQHLKYGPKSIAAIVRYSEMNFEVDYSGALAGKMPGYYEDNGIKYVVRSGPKLAEPCEGPWPLLRALIEGLLVKSESPEVGKAQWDTFHGWMLNTQTALRDGRRSPQQALCIAGPVDCGKTWLQKVITLMIGGRGAKTHRYYSGKTDFCAEIATNEHHMIDDDFMPSDMKSRLAFGSMLKQFTVSTDTVSIHPKGVDATNLPVFCRVSITVNDQVESLMTLPPLNADIADKICLLKATRFEFPLPIFTAEEKEAVNNAIRAELPGYFYWLATEFELPEERKDRRFGVNHYHHPLILARMGDCAPEIAYLHLIAHFYGRPAEGATMPPEITDTAEGFRTTLLGAQDRYVSGEAQKLVGFSTANSSTYLKRLAKKFPNEVFKKKTEKCNKWAIKTGPWIEAQDSGDE
jgi:hypothetical protein